MDKFREHLVIEVADDQNSVVTFLYRVLCNLKSKTNGTVNEDSKSSFLSVLF